MASAKVQKKSGSRLLSSLSFGGFVKTHKPSQSNGGMEDIAAAISEGLSKQLDQVGKPPLNGGQLKLTKQLEDKERTWNMLTSLSSIPISYFEPVTQLQKIAEIMGCCDLLDKADECEDPCMRLVYASSWATSFLYTSQRTLKPFDPILGETFELVNHHGISYIAEQVSDSPPLGASHAENDHFTYDSTSRLKTKFFANSIDVCPLERTRITLKRDGVVLDLVPPPSKANNIVVGKTWIDFTGHLTMTNVTTGDKVVLNFKPSRWFSTGRPSEVDGYVYNAAKEPQIHMTGKWNRSMSYQPCDIKGEPLAGTELKEVWSVGDTPKTETLPYTYFGDKINSFDTAPEKLLSSDSRLRPDRYAYETGDLSKAGSEKSRLEERQKAEKKRRKASGVKYSPKWFDRTEEVVATQWGDLEVYQFNGKYTERRELLNNSNCGASNGRETEFHPWQ
ncbi:hypothetical protein MKW98_024555 [Papaver atlanticum]|uniref:Oxysterol-binding protein n=1 Tax=Papaver atlanticum TaxID=357466 RepID=A0AAD4S762_9MAGN|nr:hypothetical protein MKW98_024555 [Papaver atlanticum]